MERRKTLQLAAMVAALLVASSVGARAETYKLKIGAGHAPVGLWVATMRDVFVPRVTERVSKETSHKIEWTEAYGGTVCKPGECLEAVESGLLDIADVHAPTEPAKLIAQNSSRRPHENGRAHSAPDPSHAGARHSTLAPEALMISAILAISVLM